MANRKGRAVNCPAYSVLLPEPPLRAAGRLQSAVLVWLRVFMKSGACRMVWNDLSHGGVINPGEVKRRLQVEPELRAGLEISRQPGRCFCRHRAFFADNFLQTVTRHTNGLGQRASGKGILRQEILAKDFTGVNRAWQVHRRSTNKVFKINRQYLCDAL